MWATRQEEEEGADLGVHIFQGTHQRARHRCLPFRLRLLLQALQEELPHVLHYELRHLVTHRAVPMATRVATRTPAKILHPRMCREQEGTRESGVEGVDRGSDR